MLKRNRIAVLGAVCLAVFLGACATKLEPKDYTAFRAQNPKSVLVVPVVNRSIDIDAPDYFLATITKPLAERGYYVFPVHMVKRVMEDDGLSDADLVHQADTRKLAGLFGADTVLYVTIHQWDAKYVVLTTKVTVDIEYVLKSGVDGSVLWTERQVREYQPQSTSSGNIIADLVIMAAQAAATKAAPNYMPLTREANAFAVYTAGQGLPAGPYHANHLRDVEQFGTNVVQAKAVTDAEPAEANPEPADETVEPSSAGEVDTGSEEPVAADEPEERAEDPET